MTDPMTDRAVVARRTDAARRGPDARRRTFRVRRSGLLAASAAASLVVVLAAAGDQASAQAARPAAHGDALVGVGVSGSGALDAPGLPDGTTWVGGAVTDNASLGLRSDGRIMTWGSSHPGLQAPDLPAGTQYVDVTAVGSMALAVRSDGAVVAFQDNYPNDVDEPPALPAGVGYVDAELPKGTGDATAAALRSDGRIVVWGHPGLAAVPELPPGVTYVGLDLGYKHAVALRSDGRVVTWGDNSFGQRELPEPPAGEQYVDVAAGSRHTVALASDGTLGTAGQDSNGQLAQPAVPPGRRIVDVVGGRWSTFYVIDDGSVLGQGYVGNATAAENLPPAPDQTRYTQVIAGGETHALLVRRSVATPSAQLTGPTSWRYGAAPVRFDVTVEPGSDASGGEVGLVRAGSPGMLSSAVLGPTGHAKLVLGRAQLQPGVHLVRAVFGGSEWAAPASSSTREVRVRKARSKVLVTAAESGGAGDRLPIGIRVRSRGVTPTGVIAIRDGDRLLQRLRLRASDAGSATATLPRLRAGRHRISVTYAGSSLTSSARDVHVLRVR